MKLSRKYDRYFKRVPLPLAYVRALSYRESRLNPANVTPPDAPPSKGARGLMQVMNVNRRDYNEKHGTDWTSDDMLDPAKNVRVFADTVGRMLAVYKRNGLYGGPTRESLLLVTAGWNSGYGDVLRIARYLRDRDIRVTHANLFKYAPEAVPGSTHRWTPEKEAWQRSVVKLYEQQDEDTEGDAWWLLATLWILSSQR